MGSGIGQVRIGDSEIFGEMVERVDLASLVEASEIVRRPKIA